MNAVISRGLPAPIVGHATNTNRPAKTPAQRGNHCGVSTPQNQGQQSGHQLTEEALLRRFVDEASAWERKTGKACSLWGHIGESYAALRFGVKLSRKNAQGHDGRLGNNLVEIKTITPLKRKPFVRAKRAGNFSLLAVIRVYPDHHFEARLVRRECLPKARAGAYVFLSWDRACALADSCY